MLVPSTDGGPTRIGINQTGALAAVWVQDPGFVFDGPAPAVRVIVRSARGRQSAFMRVGNVGVTSVDGVFVDPEGRATIVYTQDGSGVNLVRCTTRDCGRQRVLDSRGVLTGSAGDESGRVLVMWRGRTSRGPRLRFTMVASGHASRPKTLGETGGQPSVAVSGRRFLAAWAVPGALRTAVVRTTGEMSRPRTIEDDPYERTSAAEVVAAGAPDGFIAASRPDRTRSKGVTVIALDRLGRKRRTQRLDMAPGGLAVFAAPKGRALLSAGSSGTPSAPCVDLPYLALRAAGTPTFSTAATASVDRSMGCAFDAAMDRSGRAIAAQNTADGFYVALTGATGAFAARLRLADRRGPSTCCGTGPLVAVSGTRSVVLWDDGTNVLLATRGS